MLRAIILILTMLAGSLHCEAADRVALVIGNGAYETLTPRLPNPPRDATAIAGVLKGGLGFEVEVLTDATKDAMDDAVARLAREARAAEITLLFYAGHGIQDRGLNYLAPVDATLAAETDLRRRFIRLDDVLDDLTSAQGARILLLDACRDNDAIEALRAALPSRSANVTRGLARVSAADGQLIAFATQPDRVASDGDGEHSPFTAALLARLGQKGVELRTTLTRVRVDVAKATRNGQIPEVADSLVGEVYLTPDAGTPLPSVDLDTPTDNGGWAAIAYEDYDAIPGNVFASSRGATREEAVDAAIQECAEKSQNEGNSWPCVVTKRSEEDDEPVIQAGCLSLYSNDGGTWRFAKASTKRQAERSARLACIDANERGESMADPCKRMETVCVVGN